MTTKYVQRGECIDYTPGADVAVNYNSDPKGADEVPVMLRFSATGSASEGLISLPVLRLITGW